MPPRRCRPLHRRRRCRTQPAGTAGLHRPAIDSIADQRAPQQPLGGRVHRVHRGLQRFDGGGLGRIRTPARGQCPHELVVKRRHVCAEGPDIGREPRNSRAIAADTSSAAVGSTPVVGTAAAALAARYRRTDTRHIPGSRLKQLWRNDQKMTSDTSRPDHRSPATAVMRWKSRRTESVSLADADNQ
jgi:hypothetical protein